MNPTNSHCELFFLLRSVKQSRKGSVLGFQPYEPNELHKLNKLSFLATVSSRFQKDSLLPPLPVFSHREHRAHHHPYFFVI